MHTMAPISMSPWLKAPARFWGMTALRQSSIRLFTDDNQRCFGPGIATLLERVREHRSLRAAASSMEMAYSKAWRIIRTAEEVFGCKMLRSTTGGRHGGGAVLTPEYAREIGADFYAKDAQQSVAIAKEILG